jgi:hypothetical protein
MEFAKRYILESIGFVVGTPNDYLKMAEAEQAFLRRHAEHILATDLDSSLQRISLEQTQTKERQTDLPV